ncbi:staurosporin and temperature sensitive-like protein A, putative [Medicago truncatula]|uniref:Staurosporin and temperature sensitive-like protein A, putative n=1 Tax=Medicago truncatula TaxID=3880 RepID=G7IKW6_MEDTR|nr:staurosporin and temperature sensitive-like protein A, putative [Medicago truncatula]
MSPCIFSVIALSQAFDVFTRLIKLQLPSLSVDSHSLVSESVMPNDTHVEKPPSKSQVKKMISVLLLKTSIIAILLFSPSIVLTSRSHDGLHVFNYF